jgi:hypothetical protein
MSDHCLNCGNHVHTNYCDQCGQKTSTHRFSLGHVFSHDFVHGIFHLDKGLFYTIKELFIRPGHSIREFISGKRVKHFNYFTLILLIITFDLLLRELSPVDIASVFELNKTDKTAAAAFDTIAKKYPKLFALATIPLYAAFSWLFFRKALQNFAEHLVLNGYRAAGELLLGLITTFTMIFVHDHDILKSVMSVVAFILVIYSTFFYSQYFSVFDYSKTGLILRSFMAVVLVYILLPIIVSIVLLVNKLL